MSVTFPMKSLPQGVLVVSSWMLKHFNCLSLSYGISPKRCVTLRFILTTLCEYWLIVSWTPQTTLALCVSNYLLINYQSRISKAHVWSNSRINCTTITRQQQSPFLSWTLISSFSFWHWSIRKVGSIAILCLNQWTTVDRIALNSWTMYHEGDYILTKLEGIYLILSSSCIYTLTSSCHHVLLKSCSSSHVETLFLG
jgi:hypothetical protein